MKQDDMIQWEMEVLGSLIPHLHILHDLINQVYMMGGHQES